MQISQTRPLEGEFSAYHGRYIELVPPGDVIQLLAFEGDATRELYERIGEASADFRYADGKWTIRETLGHVIDTERIFAYRALRFSRGDATPLPGFEQNGYVDAGPSKDTSLPALCAEFEAVRRATICLFRNLRAEDWARGGMASDAHVSVRALAYLIAGHELHHRKVLLDRYLPALALTR